MRKVTVNGLFARKLRLALTALAIVLGVTFVTGTLILGDTLNSTFKRSDRDRLSARQLRDPGKGGLNESGAAAVQGTTDRKPVPESIASAVSRLPGVAFVHGSVRATPSSSTRNGNAIGGGGGSTLGFSFDSNRQLSPYRLVEGRAPMTADDVVMDKATATKNHFAVGDRVLMNLPDRAQTFTITGIVTYGSDDNLAGVTLAGFDLRTAQNLFNSEGHYDTISVLAASGADNVKLQLAIARLLPPGVEVVSGQAVANELSSAVDNELVVHLDRAADLRGDLPVRRRVHDLQHFLDHRRPADARARAAARRRREPPAGVPVGARRSRADGARRVGDRPRARRSRRARPEGAAQGVRDRAALGAAGVRGADRRGRDRGRRRGDRDLGDHPRAAGGADTAGRGSRRGQRGRGRDGPRRRVAAGVAVATLGVVAVLAGLAKPTLALVGLGAVLVFIAAGMLVPVAARPLSSALGRPLASLLGMPGKLGRENSMRNPRRTAQTAAALMIGLALVSTIAVLGASLSTSAKDSVDSAVSADYIVSGSGGFSKSVAPVVSRLPGVATSTTIYQGQFEFRGSLSTLCRRDARRPLAHGHLHVAAGRGAPAMAAGQLLIDTSTASTDNLHVGSVVPVKFAQTGASTMTIGGIYKPNPLVGSFVVGDGFLRRIRQPAPDRRAPQHRPRRPRLGPALNRVLIPYANVGYKTRAQFEKSQQDKINQELGLVYVLLALAVLVALIGIVNTLMLSVFERTREIGLLRAVGMKRRQVRMMIRAEAVIVALFGAVVGIVIGAGLGIALASSLRLQRRHQHLDPDPEPDRVPRPVRPCSG